MKRILVHGVPDTPRMWQPLIKALGASYAGTIDTPALPGFTAPAPNGFDSTKEAMSPG